MQLGTIVFSEVFAISAGLFAGSLKIGDWGGAFLDWFNLCRMSETEGHMLGSEGFASCVCDTVL